MLHHRLWEQMLIGLYAKQLPTWGKEGLEIWNWVDLSNNFSATRVESRCAFFLLPCGPDGVPVGGVDVALEWGANGRAGCTWAHLNALYVKCSVNVERARRRRNSMAACQRILHDDENMFFFLTCNWKVIVSPGRWSTCWDAACSHLESVTLSQIALESIVAYIPSFSSLGVPITIWNSPGRFVLPTR